ncbi:unnamed protein product [Hymenolepis diminuta]|uniref:Elongation factor Ts, mitochondrial n=1 Tax=Hymenolepis diminuta TaxID=6216 RepID=A0A0R3SDW0_HYMDI|nr:unnamed protein product [Hymenolepis diminuta]VUZ54172.1 unnamed protein product [Hymenolepis diminuta]
MLSRWHRLLSSFQISKVVGSNYSSKSGSSSSSLAQLRKATGHPFVFCREALAVCNGDYDRALAWLQNEATKRGMTKAEKLKLRPMSQGLLGMIASTRCVAVVEVNCETDFVARNQDFQYLVASSTESLFKFFSEANQPGTHMFSGDDLKAIPNVVGSQQQTIGELLANIIGSLGENMAIPRGVGMALSGDKANEFRYLTAYCHMSNTGIKKGVRDVVFGKYIAILRYRHMSNQKGSAAWHEQASRFTQQLCQHIVGMNPHRDLSLDAIPQAENPDEEKCLLRQGFLFDESVPVGTLLEQNEIVVEDFVRVECGVGDEED